MTEEFNFGETVRRVRAIEAKIKAEEDKFEAGIKDLRDYAEQKRQELLHHLLSTNQKSANSDQGGAQWKEYVTYRVVDKSEFQRHVIGTEAWEMITWAAASVAAGEFHKEHGHEPPGTFRNAVLKVTVTPPPKKKLSLVKGPAEQEPEPQAAE